MVAGRLRGRRRRLGHGGRLRGLRPRLRPLVALARRRDGLEVLGGLDEAVGRVVREGGRHEGERRVLVHEVGRARPLLVCRRRGAAPRCNTRRLGEGRESLRIAAHAQMQRRGEGAGGMNL